METFIWAHLQYMFFKYTWFLKWHTSTNLNQHLHNHWMFQHPTQICWVSDHRYTFRPPQTEFVKARHLNGLTSDFPQICLEFWNSNWNSIQSSSFSHVFFPNCYLPFFWKKIITHPNTTNPNLAEFWLVGFIDFSSVGSTYRQVPEAQLRFRETNSNEKKKYNVYILL